MKKIIQLMLLIGFMNGVVRGSEIKEKDISFGPKLRSGLKENRYAPSTYARIKLQAGERIPEGYSKVSESRDYHPYAYNPYRTEGYHVGESRFYQRKLPISARHEKYNMFIEGYEPKEEFKKRIITNTAPSEIFKDKSQWPRRWAERQELLASPEYQEQQAQERERLSEVERQSRARSAEMAKQQSQYLLSRLQYATYEREQGLWSRFLNWLHSFKRPTNE